MGAGASSDGGKRAKGKGKHFEGAIELRQEVHRLQERIRDLENAAQNHSSATAEGGESWYNVLGREPTLAVVRLTRQTCDDVRRLFAAVDVNAETVLSQKDLVPKSKKSTDVKERALRLLDPVGEFLVRGEVTEAELCRGMARRAAREMVEAPPGVEDSIAGWLSRVEVQANEWVRKSVAEVLDGDESGRDMIAVTEHLRFGTLTCFDPQPTIRCTPLTAIALAFSNLGYLTSHDNLFLSAELELWVVHYLKMSLSEAFHIARKYSDFHSCDCHIAMVHGREGDVGLEGFRRRLTAVAAATMTNDSIGILLFDPATAHGSRGIEGRENSIHGGVLEWVDTVADEAVIVDTNPKKFGLRWRCPIELLHLACCAVSGHDELRRPCGGLLTISRKPQFLTGQDAVAADDSAGEDLEVLGSASAQRDCFGEPPPWLPQLNALSSEGLLPCQGLAVLCAGLSAIERQLADTSAMHLVQVGWPGVDALCATLGLPVSNIVEAQPTLAELADLADQWARTREVSGFSLSLEVTDDSSCLSQHSTNTEHTRTNTDAAGRSSLSTATRTCSRWMPSPHCCADGRRRSGSVGQSMCCILTGHFCGVAQKVTTGSLVPTSLV
jgi:hypothetical protein